MYDVITIGGALRDFTFYVKEGKILNGQFIFLTDSKILVPNAYFTNGGGANNVAVGLARFGLKVALISRIGQDFSGQAILKNLRKHKITTKYVQIDPKLHTGVSVIIQKEGKGKVLFTFRGASDKLSIINYQLFKNTKWVYIASLTGDWEKILNKVFSIRSKSVRVGLSRYSGIRVSPRVAWNPGAIQLAAGQKKLAKYLKQTEVLILNRHEAVQLINLKAEIHPSALAQDALSLSNGRNPKQIRNFKSQIKKLLIKLYQLGPKIVAITCGRKGAFVYDGKKFYYQPAKKTKPKDATGAGDAFSSGFLAGLILFNDIKKALKLGILNSGAVIKVVGAQEGLLDKRILKNL
jgi:sugar/nucleoside kinase (ribokinase family)